jgi:hypothetical protein
MAVQEHEVAGRPKTLHVRVVDKAKEGEPVVNIKMPVGVVKFGMKMAKTFSPQMKDVDIDWDAIGEMVEHGELGKIVDVDDEAEHKTVEVWLE